MTKVCKDRRNHRDFRFGGGGGGGGGAEVEFASLTVFPGGVVGGIGPALPELSGMDAGGAVWTLPCGGVGGTSGMF